MTTTTLRRGLGALLAGAALSLGAAACGEDEPGAETGPSPAPVNTNTPQQDTAPDVPSPAPGEG